MVYLPGGNSKFYRLLDNANILLFYIFNYNYQSLIQTYQIAKNKM